MKKPLRIVLLLLLSCLACGVLETPKSAWSKQEAAEAYLTDAIPAQFNSSGLDPKTDRNKIADIRRVRGDFESKVVAGLQSGNALSAADQGMVRNWVEQVLLAEMTTLNADAQTGLGKMRQDFIQKIVRQTSDSNRPFLLGVVLPKVVDVASKNYHPAARINAAIIIGLLDAQEGVPGERPPKLYLAALGELLKIIDNPESPEYLVAASLSGVQRHAEIDGQLPARERLRADIRTRIVDSMLKVIAKHDSNQAEDQPGYLLSRRAVQTLAGLSLPAADPQVADVKTALTKVATKTEAGKWLRLDAFLALSELPIDTPKVYLDNLGQLVVYVTKDARARVLLAQQQVKIDEMIKDKTGQAKEKKARSTGPAIEGPVGATGANIGDNTGAEQARGSMGGMTGMSGLSDFSEDGLFPYHLHYARIDVKLVVSAARSVLGASGKTPTGLKAAYAADAETTKLIDELEKELKALLAATDIGFVEEKPLTAAQERTMAPAEKFLRSQSNSVRVLAGMGRSSEALEKLVGKVELPKSGPASLPATTPVGTTNPPAQVPADQAAPANTTAPANPAAPANTTAPANTDNQGGANAGSEAGSGSSSGEQQGGEGGETTGGANGGGGNR